MEISVAAEKLFSIGSVQITNAIFTSFIVCGLIILFSIFVRLELKYKKPGKIQLLLEMMIDVLLNLLKDVMSPVFAKKLMGFLMTFFVFILVSNWFGLLPFVPALSIEKAASKEITEEVSPEDKKEEDNSFLGCISSQHCYISTHGIKKFDESVHILRAPSSDLSMALSLAFISVIVTNVLGIRQLGLSYFKKYINIKNPIDLIVGILEIFSELGKIISFSFRLFGNVFAGEVLLAVITGLTFGVATLPFYALEVFVGAIQAFVFFFLTAVFIGLAVKQEH